MDKPRKGAKFLVTSVFAWRLGHEPPKNGRGGCCACDVHSGPTDGDRELGSVADWTQYLGIIDVKLAEAVDRLEAAIAEGTLTWTD